jgi:hypothetical protein
MTETKQDLNQFPLYLQAAIVSAIGSVIKSSSKDIDNKVGELIDEGNIFRISVDAKIHIEVNGVTADFSLVYPQAPTVNETSK